LLDGGNGKMNEKTEKLRTRLVELLEAENWLGNYHIVEVKEHDFLMYFEEDEDAEKFNTIIQQYGATTSLHSCH
jgi:hypothetical protein